MTDRSTELRAFFARYITLRSGVSDPRVGDAFAAVPRENFVGPGPWFIPGGPAPLQPGAPHYFETPDCDLAFIYQDVLVALDPVRSLNNGEPSLHALLLDALAVQPGETILHIGAGTGYYTAILAELTGAAGRVHGYEIDEAFAARAAANLASTHQAGVRSLSGTLPDMPKADAIYVNAGTTQPEWVWLDALNPGGRLLFPLQAEGGYGGGFGAMLLITKPPQGGLVWPARFVCRAGFITLQGRQNAAIGDALNKAFDRGGWENVRHLHLNDTPDDTSWVNGDGWWLSSAPNG